MLSKIIPLEQNIKEKLPRELQAQIMSENKYPQFRHFIFHEENNDSKIDEEKTKIGIYRLFTRFMYQSYTQQNFSQNFNSLEVDNVGTCFPSSSIGARGFEVIEAKQLPKKKFSCPYIVGKDFSFDGPNDHGTFLFHHGDRIFLYDNAHGATQGDQLEVFDKISSFALCKNNNNWAVSIPEKIYFNLSNQSFVSQTNLTFNKIAFLSSNLMMGLTHDHELYILQLSSAKQGIYEGQVIPFKQNFYYGTKEKKLYIKDFAINSTCPNFVLIYCALYNSPQHYLCLMDLKSKKLILPGIFDKVDIAKFKLWFKNNRFGWVNSQGILQIHAFEFMEQ